MGDMHSTLAAVRGTAGAGRSRPIDPALLAELTALYADAAAALDERRYADWIELFTAECDYVLQPRENHARGLPLATLALEGQGMLRDRIYGIEQTLFHQPYYQRHVLGPLRLLAADADAQAWEIESNYAVFRTRTHELSEVMNVGRTLDRVVRDGGLLKFAKRTVVFDSENIPNSVIYPI